ncbi:MAG: class I SAM-dependent methyltransferase [Rhodothermales bacterium]|nr:class I SAM-dependent methyltransferase [Rhodothermales bacterium]MBO6781358.1 class I SAM-dependent methyltransferase [Rhodothermales bacterium]
MAHKVLDFAHNVAARILRPGDAAVDATVGNGHDTRFLAERVGPGGQIWGFDVQAKALRRAHERLRDVSASVTLIRDSHASMAAYVAMPMRVALFNLGYLPGGSRAVTTTAESTITALEASWSLLTHDGRIVLVLYRGHPGGAEEARAVLDWAGGLGSASVVRFGFTGRGGAPPEALVVARRPSHGSR